MPLNMKDSIQLSNWLRGGATLGEVESVERFGLVENERFTEAARERFRFIHRWSAPRFCGQSGEAQERFYLMHGWAALDRRIARVNAAVGRWLKR